MEKKNPTKLKQQNHKTPNLLVELGIEMWWGFFPQNTFGSQFRNLCLIAFLNRSPS